MAARAKKAVTRPWQANDKSVAAHGLDPYALGRSVVRTLDEDALPVSGNEPVVDPGRAHVDADHIGAPVAGTMSSWRSSPRGYKGAPERSGNFLERHLWSRK